MYSSSGGDARSTAASNARDSSSSMPPDHLSAWDRQAFGRDKFDRADRDRHATGKKEWTSDRSSSGQSSHRSSSVLSVNGNFLGPPNKRRAIGRHGVLVENGRYGAAVGRSSDSSALRGTASPVENGKAERDAGSLSGGPSPGYSGSPGIERPNKDLDGHHARESSLSLPEGRLSSSPRLDPLSRPHGTPEAVSSWERERPKFGSTLSWDTPHRERESRERMLSKPEFSRRTASLPKLDTGRDWSLGDRELEGRVDRYGSASIREHTTLEVSGGRKEHSRHDWRVRDRTLLSPFSSRTPTSSNNSYVKDVGPLSVGSEVSGITKSPQLSPLESSSAQEFGRDDVGLVSPRKRPRLTWGQGLAMYEKQKVEEDPAVVKKSMDGTSNDLSGSLKGHGTAGVEHPVFSVQSGSLLASTIPQGDGTAGVEHPVFSVQSGSLLASRSLQGGETAGVEHLGFSVQSGSLLASKSLQGDGTAEVEHPVFSLQAGSLLPSASLQGEGTAGVEHPVFSLQSGSSLASGSLQGDGTVEVEDPVLSLQSGFLLDSGSLQEDGPAGLEHPVFPLQPGSILASSKTNDVPCADQNHGQGLIEPSLNAVHVELSSGPHEFNVCAGQEIASREKCLDEEDGKFNYQDTVPDGSPHTVSENFVSTSTVSQHLVLHDAQVLIAGASENISSISKDLLTQQLERVEFEIDVVEKELVKLEIECGKEHVPVANDGLEAVTAGDHSILPENGELSSQPELSSIQLEAAASPACAIHMVIAGDQSIENAVVQCEGHPEDLGESAEDVSQVVLPVTEGLSTEIATGLISETEAGSFVSDFPQAYANVAKGNLDIEIPDLEPQEIARLEIDQGVCLVEREDFVSHLLQTNRETAKCSFDSLAHLLPKCGPWGTGNLHGGGKFYGSPQEAEVWKVNADSHDRKMKVLESKVAEEDCCSRLIDRVLAVKYRALRESWKQEQVGNGQRKERPKAGRHGEPEQRNGSVPPRTSLRLRPVTCPTMPDAVGEEVQVMRKLWNEPQMDCERAYLRMPSMLLNDKERALHKFVTNNALVEDPVAVEKERSAVNPWTGEEKKIFLDKYSLFGKSFSKVASFLKHKTVADCVEFYYRNQKSEDFDKVRKRHQLKKRRDHTRSSGSYLATTTSLYSRHREANAARVEGLTLVAAAAAALSVQRDLSKVVRSANKIVERARHIPAESGSSDTPSKPVSDKSAINDGPPLFSLSPVATSSCPHNNASIKVYRDRNMSRQGSNSILPIGKGSYGELQSGVKGARSVHARSLKGSSEEIDSQWTDSDRELFTCAVTMFGKDFHSISLHIGSKSQGQCKAFFSKTRKRLGLDKLVERHKITLQAGIDPSMNDAKQAVPPEDMKSLQNVEEIINMELNNIHPKPLAAQGAEGGRRENPEEEASVGEKSLHAEGSLTSESSKVLDVQAVNTMPQELNVLGHSPSIIVSRFPQTGTEVRLSDDVIPDTSDTCIVVPTASNNAVKEEACTADNGNMPIAVSQDANSIKDAPAVVQSCFPEASLVCPETLQFKTEAVCIKMEPNVAPNNVQDTSNTLPTRVPLSVASAVPVLSSSSLTSGAVTLPALLKDRSLKVTETKTRREPTSWTQEEKEKFLEIIRKHGKNWDRLRENLPAKSLTQIKTYFQNSKAKLGLAPEGTGSGNGRGGSSRKRKADDSDSSSNAGSGGHNVSQKVALHADEGSLKVSPNVLGPTGALGSNMVGAEALAYATLYSRNSAQVLEDPMNAQKVFHPMGLAQNSTSSAMIPMFNATGFSTPSLRPVQQPFVHPTLKAQQLVNHQQPQPSLAPLVVVQPLQQQTIATGIQQVHQLQPQQAITRAHQDLPIPVVQHLHKQSTQQPQQPNSQVSLQQQQVVQHLQQQVTEVVLQQKLQPQLIQRQQQQQQQQQQQLQLTVQQVQHHLQQALSHHQAQSLQQSSSQGASQQPQSSSDQVVGHQQVTGSQPKAASQQHQQSGQFQSQFYQINSKAQALLQPQHTTQQQQQLQQLQLQLQQHQLQFQRQQQPAHPQQQVQVQQLQKQIPGSPQLQQQNFHLLFEQQQQQQLALRRGAFQPSSMNSEAPKHSESDLHAPVKFQQGVREDLQQPLMVSQASDHAPLKSQVSSEALVRSGDVKLFGQSLLVQPGSSSQQSSCKVSGTSSQDAVSAAASAGFSTAKPSLDVMPKGHGMLASPFMQGQGWQQVMWPGVSVGNSCSGSTMASILQGSTTARSGEGESESHGAKEAAASMTEQLIREARDFEDGRISELAALSHLARLQDGRSLSSILPNLDNSVLSDPASLQCILSAEVNRLDSDSKRCDQLGVSDRGLQGGKARGPDLNPLSVTMPLGQVAASQGLPRVLDALVALAEWQMQQANTSSGRLTEEFLSQSWEALHRDPNSLVEAGKVNESLAQTYAGGPEMLQHPRDSVYYSHPHLMHLQPHTSVGGGAWGSSSLMPLSDSQQVLTPPSSSFRSHNGAHNPASSDEQGRVESRDLDSSGGAVG